MSKLDDKRTPIASPTGYLRIQLAPGDIMRVVLTDEQLDELSVLVAQKLSQVKL